MEPLILLRLMSKVQYKWSLNSPDVFELKECIHDIAHMCSNAMWDQKLTWNYAPIIRGFLLISCIITLSIVDGPTTIIGTYVKGCKVNQLYKVDFLPRLVWPLLSHPKETHVLWEATLGLACTFGWLIFYMVKCRVRLRYHGVKKEAPNLSQVPHFVGLGHVHNIMFYTCI